MSIFRPKYGTILFGMITIDLVFQGWGINNWSDIQIPGEDDVRGSLEKRKLNFLPSFGMLDSVSLRLTLYSILP
jgi:hypothetical protein